MSRAYEAIPRPRRWWIAFTLNLFLPPSGYAYAGAWVTAAMAFLLIVLVPMILLLATSAYPPGIYGLGPGALFASGAGALLALATHAAWVAARSPAKTGPRLVHGWLYLATWVGGFATNLLLQAYWPNPTYEVAADAMAPSLKAGDVLVVDGARALCGRDDLKPGQVVLFRRPGAPTPSMLRVVAGPGQIVSLDAGRLRVDGRLAEQRPLGTERLRNVPVPATVVQETLPGGPAYRTLDLEADGDLDTLAPVKTPSGSWFLLSDNRDSTTGDSRTFGPVSGRDICAVGQKVIASREARRVGQAL